MVSEPPAVQHIDQIEHAQRVEAAEGNGDEQRRPDQRKRHSQEQFRPDRRRPSVPRHRCRSAASRSAARISSAMKGVVFRTSTMITAQSAGAGIRRPGDRLRDHADPHQQIVHDAELVVEHPAPHSRRDHGRDRPGMSTMARSIPRPGKWTASTSAKTSAEQCLKRDRYQGEPQGCSSNAPHQTGSAKGARRPTRPRSGRDNWRSRQRRSGRNRSARHR